jgi:hypothetical protein
MDFEKCGITLRGNVNMTNHEVVCIDRNTEVSSSLCGEMLSVGYQSQ